MIKITRETDYGIVLMSAAAQDAALAKSAAALAKRCHLPLPMVSKILKALANAGLLVSQRGAHGGYALARSATAISVADIIEALEGPIAMTECSTADPNACLYHEHCTVSSHWHRINVAIRDALRNISLLEMSRLPSTQRAALATVNVALPSLVKNSVLRTS
ncbi:MAG: SUF system Fe-S cluster assembly regulator [Gammaproteobacteria bacterium]